MRILFAILLVISTLIGAESARSAKPKRDISNVKKEQQAAKREIAETSKKITANAKETNRMLAKLNSLSAEAAEKKIEVDRLKGSVDSIDRVINKLNDSIEAMDKRVESLRENYAKSLRSMQGNFSNMNTLSFVFSSKTFSRAWQRVRYVQQLGKWRKQRAKEIKAVTASLTQRRVELDSMQTERKKSMTRLTLSQKQLEEQKTETDKLVAQLQKEGSDLKAVLKEKERKAKALDGELDRLIAEEQRRIEQERIAAEKAAAEKKQKEEAERKRKEAEEKKRLAQAESEAKKQTGANASAGKPSTSEKPTSNEATSNNSANSQSGASSGGKTSSANEATISVAEANRALTGSFESNKGKLLFPVAGKYRVVRGFGRQKHPELAHVETDNSGIDVEAVGGGTARAVFAGKVSEIFQQPGYGTIVMVRHGSYLTIYANLSSINVKKGDELKSGQTIGTIYADPEENGAAILHFELRKERTKLNPLEWVK